jgi:endonuclease/exonuclease/phosphatase family metal-dependent hydrolase
MSLRPLGGWIRACFGRKVRRGSPSRRPGAFAWFAVLLVLAVACISVAAGLSTASDDTADNASGGSVLDDPEIQAAAQRSVEEQAQRDAARDTTAAHADRAESRDAYRDLSASEALATDRSQLPDAVSDPAFRPFEPDPGAHVERYRNDDTAAVIETAQGDHVLAESDLPLRGTTASGTRAPVDLTLADHGTDFAPESAPVRATLPDELGAAATLPVEGGTITVRAQGASVRSVRADDDKLLYANAQEDTDVLAATLPTGIEFSNIARSPAAPESFEYELGGLPAGAELRTSAGGHAAEIVDGGQVLAMVDPPTALAADGEPLPVSLSMAGNRIEVTVRHRDRDVAYPIVVDPPIETFAWHDAPTTDYSGWAYTFLPAAGSPAHTPGLTSPPDHTSPYGAGLFVKTNGNNLFSLDDGINRYTPPGDAYVYRADFNLANWNYTTTGGPMCTNAGIYSVSRGAAESSFYVNCSNFINFNWGVCVAGTYPSCDASAGTAGNSAQTDFWAWGNGQRQAWTINGWTGTGAFSYTGAATIYVNDRVKPTVQWSGDPPVSSWSEYGGPFAVLAQDSGLGVKTLALTAPATAPNWAGASRDTGCTGTRADRAAGRCPATPTVSFSLAGLPEGPQTLHATATDAVGNSATPLDYPLKIDRSAPSSVTFSGELGTDVNKVVGKTQVGLRVSGTDSYSGTASVSYTLTRSTDPATILKQGSWSNSACTASGCSGGYNGDFSIDTTTLQDGTYTITGKAVDQVGHFRTNTLSFTVDGSVLTPAQALAAVQASHPDIVAPSTQADSDGDTLSPTLTGPAAGNYGSDGTLREATSVETDYDQGFDVGATGAEVGISPTGVGPDATNSIVASGDAAVYANTQYATDTVVRPSANGVETFLQLRNGAAPESFSWRVALGPTESLVSKSNGDIAVVDSTAPVRAETLEVPPTLPSPDDVVDNPDDRVPSDPDVNDIPPPDDTGPITFDTPTVTEEFEAPGVSATSLPAGTDANDTAAQANRETAAAASAQSTTSTGEVQAVFLKPTAQDAAGRSVPVTMSVSGSTITVAVSHRSGGFTYPITVDPETSAAGDDGGASAELEAARTGEIRVMTWNIKGSPKGGPANAHLGSVAGMLTSQHPEVALLQEVCNGQWLDELHRQLNNRGHAMLIWFYREGGATPNSKFTCGDGTAMGNAIAVRAHSARHLRDKGKHDWPKSQYEAHSRSVIAATLDTAGKSLRVYSTHLPLHGYHPRRYQIQWLGRAGEAQANGNPEIGPRVVIGGDFNKNPYDIDFKLIGEHGFELGAPRSCGTPGTGEGHYTLQGYDGIERKPAECDDQIYDYSGGFSYVASDIVYEMNHATSDHFPVLGKMRYK